MSRQAVVRIVIALVSVSVQSAPTRAETPPVHAGTRLLRSGNLVVEVGDPDSPECRWNEGLRFSPVANVLRAQLDEREFLYSPVDGGALSYLGGLPMEFDIGQEAFQPDPPGYNEGMTGDPFLKIGVGILRRDGGAYSFSASYPVVELARTTVTWGTDRARFVQTLAGNAKGYSCRLEEDLIVKNDRIIMSYLLRNTGTRRFTTEQYLHNFVCFSGRSVGPNVKVSFPYDFTASPDVARWAPSGRVRSVRPVAQPDVVRVANAIVYMNKISSVPKIWIYKPLEYTGPDLCAAEHTDTEQRLIIEASIPAAYVGIWTTDYQVSPERFLQISLAPGDEAKFTRTYTFRIDGFVPEDGTGDGTVDGNDLSLMSSAWLSGPASARWQPSCDISPVGEERIDLHDLSALAGRWRQEHGLVSPIAHWKLDETAGATAVEEYGRRHGLLRNFPDDGSQWVAGMSSGALRFDGLDDVVEVAGDSGMYGTRPRAVAAWIRLTEKPSTTQTILAWGDRASARDWRLEVDANRKFRFSCGSGLALASGKLVGDTQWHHIAAVLDPLVADSPHMSDVRLYVDAQPQVVLELAEQPIDTADIGNLRMGASHDPNAPDYFNGVLDDVQLFDAALSSAQIRELYRH
ncbi:MAG: hypothetical protein JW955_14890 [Sedimentisphaerales bacterium]|nr:hypothetical protein [Sedimentisphaerales bacterium]